MKSGQAGTGDRLLRYKGSSDPPLRRDPPWRVVVVFSMVLVMHVTAAILLLAGVVWAKDAGDAEDPDLLLRVAPRVSIAPPGGMTPILLTAEIVGPETEEYYCPEVVWLWPNGTRSSQESDCEPFAERVDYPRRFTRRIGAHSYPRAYMVCVELRKGGEVVDRTCARYRVR